MSCTRDRYAPAFTVDEGPVLNDKVKICMENPRSKSTKAIYFSSLTPLMAAISGRMAARQQTAAATLATRLLMAAAGGRVAAKSHRVKERDPLFAVVVQSEAV